MNFPILDKFPIKSRINARKEISNFANNLCDHIKKSNETIDKSELNLSNSMIAAVETGIFTEKQFRDNAVIVFIAGHENPQLFMTTLLYVCAKYPVSLTSTVLSDNQTNTMTLESTTSAERGAFQRLASEGTPVLELCVVRNSQNVPTNFAACEQKDVSRGQTFQ